MIDIKYKDGSQEKVRLSVEISEKAIYRKELMTDEYVLLPFNTATLVHFRKGDYIDTGFGRFEIVQLDKPKQDTGNTGGWSYELKFHAPWYRWTTRKLFYARQKGFEKEWHMTQRPGYFMQIVIDNLADAGFGDFTAQIDPELTEMKLVQFDGDSIVDGLTKIAEAWESEWWVSDNVIHLSKCEYGTPVKFEVGDVITEMQPGGSKDDEYATRLYAFGSTRNIPTNYRKNEDAEAVIEGVVERRLKLPEGTDHIDAWPNLDDKDVVEAVVSFDKVYPRRTGTIDSITTEIYRDEVVDDEHPDGELVEWEAIRFKDSGIVFKSDYILPDTELRITFQTGALAGMDFEVRFNPDGADESTSDAQVWEIIRNDTYGIDLPNEKFRPQAGNTYILYGYDCQMVSDLLIPAAEQELLEEAKKWLAKKCRDNANYSCPTNPIRCAGYRRVNHQWEHYTEDEIDLDVGQMVELVSDNYFPDTEGRRKCRIRAFEKRLDNKYNCTYEIGETADYSRTEELDAKVDALAVQNNRFIGGAGNGAYIITRHDTTPATDHNLYSALRSRLEFALKTAAQKIRYIWTFLKGLRCGEYVTGASGAQIDGNGNAEFESIISRSYLKVYELIYNRLNAQEGEVSFSDSGTIENITITEGGDINVEMRKRWDGDFTAFQVGDVVYGYVNDLGNATAKEYGKAWAWVKSVDRESNTLTLAKYPDIDVPSGKNMDMTAGMMISRWGNNIAASEQTASDYHFIKQVGDRWVNTRQKSVMISCESGHIAELTGVYKPILEASNFGTVLGQLPEGLLDPETEKYVNLAQPYLYARGVIVQDLIRINYKGEEIRTPRFRGEWDAATAASADDYYRDADSVVDIVTWKGCLWQCVTSHADGDAPDTENGQWMQLTERNYSEWTIEPNVNVVYIRKGTESTDLIMCTVRHHTADGYTDYFTPESLDEFGIELLFSMDGQTYHEFWVRADAVLEADGEGIDLSDGSQLTIGGNNVPWIEVGDNIHLYIRGKSDGEMIDAYTIPVVKDGEDGKQGISIEERFRLYREALANIPVTTDTLKHRNPSGWETTVPSVSDGNALWMIRARIDGNDNLVDGSWSTPVRVTGLRGADGKDGVGKTGLMAYPAGEFDPDVTYESTEKTTPVVMDGRDGDGVGQYFVLMPDRVYNASYMTYKTPHEDAANNGGNWERMDRFNSIFADIIMAEFAKLASAVFSGDLMFSQQGVDKDGNFSTQYQLINKIEGGKQAFTPNLLLDFLSGDAHAKRFMAGNTIFSGDMRYGVLDNFGQGMMRGEILSPSGMGEASGTTIEETIVLSEITIGQPTQLHLEVQMYGQTSDAMFSGGNQYLRPRCSVELYNTLTAKSVDGTSGALSILNANNERTENYYKTITLPVGSYQFRLKMRYELGDAPTSVSGTKRDYARFGWKGVTVMTQNDAAYQSMRYGNGEIIGDSPANYFMTYQDEEGNMVMQMQTKKGYGIKVGPNGVQVMAAEYSGWESLESYIRGVMKQ